MKKIFSATVGIILAFSVFLAIGATIQWYHQQPLITTLSDTYTFLAENPASNGYSSFKSTAVKNYILPAATNESKLYVDAQLALMSATNSYNGGTFYLTSTGKQQYTNTSDNVTITGLSGIAADGSLTWGTLLVSNAGASGITLTGPTGCRYLKSSNTLAIASTQVGMISIRSERGMTNGGVAIFK